MAEDTYQTYKDYDAVYIPPDEREPFPRNIRALFTRHVRGHVLDIGCADGRKLRNVLLHATKVESVVAIEPSETLCAAASERLRDLPDVRVVRATLDDIEQADVTRGSFDTITLLEVLEHIEDQREVVAKVAEYLKPGGTFICSTPNRPVYGLHCRVTGERRDPTHVKELNWPEYKALMAAFFSSVSYHGFWPVMFLFRRLPAMGVLNSLPGARFFSRTMYCIARNKK